MSYLSSTVGVLFTLTSSLGFSLALGFPNCIPRGMMQGCSVSRSLCVISLSPLLTRHFTESEQTQLWLAQGPRFVCAKLSRGPSAVFLSWDHRPLPDLERNLSLDLSTTAWHYPCPGLTTPATWGRRWIFISENMTLNGVHFKEYLYFIHGQLDSF